jgi:hypothetical protein
VNWLVIEDLIYEIAEMYEGEYGGGDWENYDPKRSQAVVDGLAAIGMTWEKFVSERKEHREDT